MGRRTIGAPRVLRRLDNVLVESVDLEGQGVAHQEGKVVFIAGALAGERVDVEVLRERPSYLKGRAVSWRTQSADRVIPRCPHFGVCGGCSMQHASPEAQVAIKQRALEDALWHIGRLRPDQVMSPMRGPSWGYRARARLSVRWVDKKGGLLVGFREKGSSYVTQMSRCEVLMPAVSAMLPALRDCLSQLTIARQIAQAEVAVGEGKIIWVLRNLVPLGPGDAERLLAFEEEQALHGVRIWMQPSGPQTAAPLPRPRPIPEATGEEDASGDATGESPLVYRLPEFGLEMPYSPVDFTQVNFAINRSLVDLAIRLLDVRINHQVADYFCGLGNFTLPLARRAAGVMGIEGSRALTDQAWKNAQRHGLQEKTRYDCINLFEVDADWLRGRGVFDRVLIDPPREGAQALCEAYATLSLEGLGPDRMVMVSCNPATLARDAAILVHKGAWRLSQAGVVNMFPQTAHVESLAVFERLPPEAVADRLPRELAGLPDGTQPNDEQNEKPPAMPMGIPGDLLA